MKWLILFGIFVFNPVSNGFTVEVSGGRLMGEVAANKSYVAYYGIPYATVGTKFQEATPDPKWNGVKIATEKNIKCTQRSDTNTIVGQEDCLILNVYVPTTTATILLPKQKLRPVMVYTHGGGFAQSSSSPDQFGPDHLMKHEVVLVTINFRLEILGFLCLRTKEAPGNIGLKDQVLALKWVQKNIKAFGGDPDNVTLFGESSGAASVVYHLLSPMSKGLFHRAIMESGTALGPYLFQFKPLTIAHMFAAQLGKDSDNLQELVTELKNKTDQELLRTRVPRKLGDVVQSENIFLPCVEKKISGANSFLEDYPYNLLTEGKYHKVPIIIGFNNEEGYRFAEKENETTVNNLNFFASLPPNLRFASDDERKEAADKFNAVYLPGDQISRKTLVEYSRYNGDSAVIFPTALTIQKFLETTDQPVYAYKFVHSGKLNFFKIPSAFENYPGATHGDELAYIFSTSRDPTVIPPKDQDMINKMTTMWTNFAKFSNPTPNMTALLPLRWDPAVASDVALFVIDNELSSAPLWGSERLQVWNSTYVRYRRRE